MIRKFKITNALGEMYDLNGESFFHNIKGLGQERKVTYVQLGTQFLKEKDLIAQKSIQGKIRFRTYKEYQKFVQFMQHKPLTLTYDAAGIYYIQVCVDKLEKTELETGGLYCNVIFKGLGIYYKKIIVENHQEETDAGKKYPSSYPFTYRDSASGTIEIESDSVLSSPVRINIFGPCVNPSYSQYVNDVLTCNGKINASIPEGHKLVIDTTQIPYSISEYKIDNTYVSNQYGKSDFSTDRFLHLEYGKNRIAFTHESSEAIMVSMEARIEYESV